MVKMQTNSVSLNAWAPTMSYPMPITGASCVVRVGGGNPGFVYCIGGNTTAGPSGVETNSVFFAPLSTGGGISGGWTSTTSYPPGGIAITSCVIPTMPAQGFVYCIGGRHAGGTITPDVFFAQVSASGVSAWSLTTSYPTPVAAESCVVYSGFIYCIGGTPDGTSFTNNVYFASLSPSGIGSWMQTAPYPRGIRLQSCVVDSGFVYCIAGLSGGASINDVFFAQLSPNGIAGSWSSTMSYPIATNGQSCVTDSGLVYCIGNNNPNVFLASLSPSGGIIYGPWTGTSPYPTSIIGTSCAVNGGFVYCVGGYDNTLGRVTNAVNFASHTMDMSTTTVMCNPNPVVVNQPTLCTATVADSSGPGPPAMPTGTVTFTPGGSCTLAGTGPGPTATCSVSITPTAAGSLTVSLIYSGDSGHTTSRSSITVTVNLRTTSPVVTCEPSMGMAGDIGTAGDPQVCTVTVTDVSPGTTSTPTGTVSFTYFGPASGSFNTTSCTLNGGLCRVTFTPDGAPGNSITGSYSGDAVHDVSSGTASAQATAAGGVWENN